MKDKLKEFFSVKKNIVKVIIGIVILLIIIIGIIVALIVTKRYDNTVVEKMMVQSTKEYLKNHSELKNENELEIDVSSLVSEGYLKDLSKLSKDQNCNGTIIVNKNNNKYRYTPKLICDNYEVNTLKNIILENDVVTSNDGLYKENEGYRFKGDYVNNYLSFANKTWRIYKIMDNRFYLILSDVVPDKNLDVVFDDRFNEEAESSKGHANFDEARIKDNLKTIYDNELQDYSSYILNHDACTNVRSETDKENNGSIECITKTNTSISLLPVYDYINASRDPLCLSIETQSCMNYNYLKKASDNWWLITPNNEVSYKVYFISSRNGSINLANANIKNKIRYVITIPDDVLYKSGKGTEKDPYTIYNY